MWEHPNTLGIFQSSSISCLPRGNNDGLLVAMPHKFSADPADIRLRLRCTRAIGGSVAVSR